MNKRLLFSNCAMLLCLLSGSMAKASWTLVPALDMVNVPTDTVSGTTISDTTTNLSQTIDGFTHTGTLRAQVIKRSTGTLDFAYTLKVTSKKRDITGYMIDSWFPIALLVPSPNQTTKPYSVAKIDPNGNQFIAKFVSSQIMFSSPRPNVGVENISFLVRTTATQMRTTGRIDIRSGDKIRLNGQRMGLPIFYLTLVNQPTPIY